MDHVIFKRIIPNYTISEMYCCLLLHNYSNCKHIIVSDCAICLFTEKLHVALTP